MPTYIAFAADGNEDMYTSDIHYYRLLMAMDAMKSRKFNFINPHEKGPSIRQGSKDETIKKTLRDRLNKSNRMILLVGETTRFDDDFVPYEIEYAVDSCQLPIIVCYVEERKRIIEDPTPPTADQLWKLLPDSLKERMNNETVRTIHIPFRERIISRSIQDFSKDRLPSFSFGCYVDNIYNEIYKPGEI